MQKLSLLLFSVFLFSCGPDEPTPEPVGPPVTEEDGDPHWIPNWSTDTLVALSAEKDPQTGRYRTDVIYSFTKGDTSMIRYDHVEYYIWTEDPDFEPDAQKYGKVKMAQVPFGPVLLGEASSAYPAKFFDGAEQQWAEQDQSLTVKIKPPFPENIIGEYSTIWKSVLD